MSKRAALILLAALVAAAAAGLAWAETRRTPDWQIAVETYVQERLDDERQWVIVEAVRARNPKALTPDLARAVPLDWTWEGIDVPYPPRAVICVLIAPQDESPARLLFAGKHNDNLWRQGWIVHEGPQPPFDAGVQENLSLLDCPLRLLAQTPHS